MKITRYHEDLTNLHINTLPPRAYFIPYASLETALSGDRNKSEYMLNLSGEWDFKYFNSFEDLYNIGISIEIKSKNVSLLKEQLESLESAFSSKINEIKDIRIETFSKILNYFDANI